MALVPKNCMVRWIKLSAGNQAEVRYQCQVPGNYRSSSYHSKKLRKITSVDLHKGHVTGKGARVDFALGTGWMRCRRDGSQIICAPGAERKRR